MTSNDKSVEIGRHEPTIPITNLLRGYALRWDRLELARARVVLFNSPSSAAAVYGNNANGRVLWKTEDGRTLKEIEESEAK